jgi:peptidoglycan pentaglycine glycine transferase (the first glycine)
MNAVERLSGGSTSGDPASGDPASSEPTSESGHEARLRQPHTDAAVVEVSREPTDPDWDAFVEAVVGGHHLQSSHWARVKAAHGWRPLRLRLRRDGEIVGGAQLLVRPLRFGAIGYCPRGPLLREDDPAPVGDLLATLAGIARRERILYVKVQPPVGRADVEPVLRENGFVASDMQAAPMATVRIDLNLPAEEILAGMRSATRQKIRKAERKGIVVREAGAPGLQSFDRLLAATGRRQGFSPYPVDYYGEILRQFGDGRKATLLLAEHDGQTLAGAVMVGYGDTAVYKMGGWSGEQAGLRPNELLHWQAIKWAKEHGYAYYDLDGINPSAARAVLAGEPLPESALGGPTFFKLGFGGEVAIYPGTYDRSFHRLLALPARIAAPRLYSIRSLAGRAHGLQGRAPTSG